jgi:hypothetical protein
MCVDIEITERVVLFWDITIDILMRVAFWWGDGEVEGDVGVYAWGNVSLEGFFILIMYKKDKYSRILSIFYYLH